MSTSPTVVTIGSSSRSSCPAVALSNARICVRSSTGRSSASLMARQPSAGFSSSGWRR